MRYLDTQQFYRNLVALNYLGVDYYCFLACSLAIGAIEIYVKQDNFLSEKH
jgi:hypothetical protein